LRLQDSPQVNSIIEGDQKKRKARIVHGYASSLFKTREDKSDLKRTADVGFGISRFGRHMSPPGYLWIMSFETASVIAMFSKRASFTETGVPKR
jgi:hypothetical protein